METASTPITVISADLSNLIVTYIAKYISLNSNSHSSQNWLIRTMSVVIMGLIGQS